VIELSRAQALTAAISEASSSAGAPQR